MMNIEKLFPWSKYPRNEKQRLWLVDHLKNETFENLNGVHNWRKYVPQSLVDDWFTLSDNERLLIFYFCEEKANEEEYD